MLVSCSAWSLPCCESRLRQTRLGAVGDGAGSEHHRNELVPTTIRVGLCFIVQDEPTTFGNTTATAIGKMKRADAPWWLLSESRAAMLAMLVQAK